MGAGGVGVEEPLPVLSRKDFDRLRKLAYEYCGLAIDETKEVLVASRLGRVMRAAGIYSFSRYYEHVIADTTQVALVTMIDSLTTNYTQFFREVKHWDFLRETVFPAMKARAELRVWSAACSTGEEPYSVAIAAREFYGSDGPAISILATDISSRVLERAREGIYNEKSFEGMPPERMRRHLLRGSGASVGSYRVRPEIRAELRFERHNLLEPMTKNRGLFSLIFCRNVMIYFDLPTQQQVVTELCRHLEPGGYLLVGHAESLNGVRHDLQYVRPATYRKVAR